MELFLPLKLEGNKLDILLLIHTFQMLILRKGFFMTPSLNSVK